LVLEITFIEDAIDSTKPTNEAYLEELAEEGKSESISIRFEIRACQPGESFEITGEYCLFVDGFDLLRCETCVDPYFNLVELYEVTSCAQYDGETTKYFSSALVGPLPTYWRKSNITAEMILCLNTGACLYSQYIKLFA
jgi:hypothetical protein